MSKRKKKPVRRVAPAARQTSWFRPAWLVWIAWAVIAAATLSPPRVRVGDEIEYLSTLVSIAEHGTVFLTRESLDTFNRLQAAQGWGGGIYITDPGKQWIGLPAGDGKWLTLHFWFYPVMAAPFYWLSKAAGIAYTKSFALLHLTLLAILLELARRAGGAAGMGAVLGLVVTSPIWWFLNKGHTEFLTFFAVTGAASLAWRGSYLGPALLLSIAGTQNPPLTLVAACLCLGWLIGRGFRRPAAKDVLLGGVIVALAVLHPLFYRLCCGYWTLLAQVGATHASFISLRRMASFLIDPDIGLYPHWPLGILLLGGGVALGRRRCSTAAGSVPGPPSSRRPWVLLAVALVLIGLPSQASTSNLNAGGTPGLARYATWYLGLYFPAALAVARRCGAWWQARRFLALGAALAAVCGAAVFNLHHYNLRRPDRYLAPTWQSRWLYAHWPSLYDPPIEIFAERNLHRELAIDPRRAAQEAWVIPESAWAITDPSCRKLLLVAARFNRAAAGTLSTPPSCEQPVEGSALFGLLKARYGELSRDLYVTLSRPEVESLAARQSPEAAAPGK